MRSCHVFRAPFASVRGDQPRRSPRGELLPKSLVQLARIIDDFELKRSLVDRLAPVRIDGAAWPNSNEVLEPVDVLLRSATAKLGSPERNGLDTVDTVVVCPVRQ